ncbi:MAG TPA: fuculose phosphate aldolase [Candidatus Atribacteria bacterium]|nr:fuculose phosphate aldolase [Candidatus Atribacteria bacterium]
MYEQFKKVGRIMYEQRLNNSHSGNMSIRVGDRIFITRRGSMLGFLKPEDIIITGFYEDDSGIALASTEIGVHRAILQKTGALAVAHGHLLMATALSIVQDEIIPIDVEGSYYMYKIPVLSFEYASGSEELAEGVSDALRDYKVVMVKGHGAFTIGNTLEEALQWLHQAESIAEIIYYVKSMGYNPKDYEKDAYKKW